MFLGDKGHIFGVEKANQHYSDFGFAPFSFLGMTRCVIRHFVVRNQKQFPTNTRLVLDRAFVNISKQQSSEYAKYQTVTEHSNKRPEFYLSRIRVIFFDQFVLLLAGENGDHQPLLLDHPWTYSSTLKFVYTREQVRHNLVQVIQFQLVSFFKFYVL